MRQQLPLTPTAVQVQNGVQHLAQVDIARPAPPASPPEVVVRPTPIVRPESVKDLTAALILELLKRLPDPVPTPRAVRPRQFFLVRPCPFAEKAVTLELSYGAVRRMIGALDNFSIALVDNRFPSNIGIHYWQFAMDVERQSWMSSRDVRRQMLDPIYRKNEPAQFNGRSWQSYLDAVCYIGNDWNLETCNAGANGKGAGMRRKDRRRKTCRRKWSVVVFHFGC